MTQTELEAVKRAIKMKEQLFFHGKGRLGANLSEQDCTDIITALSLLRPIAEGTSVVVPVEPNKATLERIALAMLTHEWNGSPPQAEVDQLSEYWIPAALFAHRAMIATTPARIRGGR